MKPISLTGRSAIVTGAGGGLGRSHALALAARGAKVLVNDVSASSAESVCSEILAAGGEATSFACSVSDYGSVQAMVAHVMAKWNRIDILVNNAGILRDRTFANMPLEDFHAVFDVHVMGSVYCTKAVWDIMRSQHYGRIVMTTSSSGLWGAFGQANYGAAKMALVGLMQTLGLEGEKRNIRVNALAPTASTAMTSPHLPPEHLRVLHPDLVSPAVVFLASEDAPSRAIICAGAGSYERVNIVATQGIHLGLDEHTPDLLAENFGSISDRSNDMAWNIGGAQHTHEISKHNQALKE